MKKQSIDRYFCHYEKLEEYHAGMWALVGPSERTKMALKAARFMKDTAKFGEFMRRVCSEWEHSCLFNFTSPNINSVPWLGQAAVCFATGANEWATRAAWNELPYDVREMANIQARDAISEWWANNCTNNQGSFFDVI